MPINTPLNLCVINGYPKRSRDALDESAVTQAHDLYLRFLRKMVPNGRLDILYIADLDTPLPDAAAYDAYIWTGSDLTIYHEVPEVTRQIEFSRAAFAAGIPQYGSCWGVQMAAVAAGGEVAKNPKGREWSIARDITLTEDGRNHPMYIGKQAQFDGFIMHLDEITRIPEGGTLLATNEHTHVQSLAVKHGPGEFWATQYHPEFTLYEMARLIGARKRPLVREGFFTKNSEVGDLVEQMVALSQEPENAELRQTLRVGDDILDDTIRQAEVRNWLEQLVIPTKQKREGDS